MKNLLHEWITDMIGVGLLTAMLLAPVYLVPILAGPVVNR